MSALKRQKLINAKKFTDEHFYRQKFSNLWYSHGGSHVHTIRDICSPISFPLCPPKGTVNQQSSGVAKLGHTGARALATRGHAPPVEACIRIIGADSIIVDRTSGTQRSWNRTAQYMYRYVYPQNYESHTLIIREFAVTYTALLYGLGTNLGDCKCLNFLMEDACPQPP